jgi:hypothetical protein
MSHTSGCWLQPRQSIMRIPDGSRTASPGTVSEVLFLSRMDNIRGYDSHPIDKTMILQLVSAQHPVGSEVSDKHVLKNRECPSVVLQG